MSTATIFVGKKLSEDQYADDSLRLKALQDATQAIQTNIEGIGILNQNDLFCSMTISGNAAALAVVSEYLEQNGIGHMDTGAEHPALNGAIIG